MTYENGAAGTLTPDGATVTNTLESSVQRSWGTGLEALL